MDFNNFTDFPVIEMWCFRQDLGVFKQNGVTSFMLAFRYGSVGQETCFETTLVFLNSNFYGPTSLSYIHISHHRSREWCRFLYSLELSENL